MIDAGFGRLTDPPASLLLSGIRIVDPSDGTDAVGDLALVDGRITGAGAVSPSGPFGSAVTVPSDASRAT